MLHPAASLLTWLVFAISLQWFRLAWLAGVAVACLLLAILFAGERAINLLRRSRWLILSLVVLYLFATPGEYLPGMLGDIGLTFEGLHQGAGQLGRLLTMLSSLALLHQAIGTPGLLAGCHFLLRSFPGGETTVVRLMLVLEHVEQKQAIGWRKWLGPVAPELATPADRITLSMPRFRWIDGVWSICMAGLLLFLTLRP